MTDKIIEYDKASCQQILKKICRDVQTSEAKKEHQQAKRIVLRNQLADRHNKTFDFERDLGVKSRDLVQTEGF